MNIIKFMVLGNYALTLDLELEKYNSWNVITNLIINLRWNFKSRLNTQKCECVSSETLLWIYILV